MAELWDVYDIHRNKTGKLHERGKPLGDGEYHLVIHVWVRNLNGDFLITKRAADKIPFPGLWECTGGSALAGEDSLTAALRETLEETGIDHRDSEKKCVLSYTRGDWHGDVWLFTCDLSPSDVHLQSGETTDVCMASKEAVLRLFREGEFCGYDYIEEFMKMI